MSSKAKVWVGYGALMTLSAVLVVLCAHYRSLAGSLPENLVLPAAAASPAEAPTPEAAPEFDLEQASRAIEKDRGGIMSKIIRPAIRRGVTSGLTPLQIVLGVELPRTYYWELVSEVEGHIESAARAAITGEDIEETLAISGYRLDNPEGMAALRKQRLARPEVREYLELLLKSIKGQLEKLPEAETE